MKAMFAAVIVWAGALGAMGADPLVNRSFEDPADPKNAACPNAAGWQITGDWLRRETGWQPRHWGPCMMAYHHWRVTAPKASGFSQDLPSIAPQSDCRFSVFVCRDPESNFKSVELRLEPLGGGKPLAAQQFELKTIPAGAWQTLSVEGHTSTSPGVRVVVAVTPSPVAPRQGALKIDDLSLEIGVTNSAPKALSSPARLKDRPNSNRRSSYVQK